MVAVRGSPKPPPTRVTLTMPALSHAREVWFVASGEDKAKAVHLALSGAGVVQIPAAGPRGIAAHPLAARPGGRLAAPPSSPDASP